MKNQTLNTVATIFLVCIGGLGIVLVSFAVTGFPFPSEPLSYLFWVELAVLVVLLGIPLFR